MTTKRFALGDIVIEPSLQSRSKFLHPPTVTRYSNIIRAAGGDVKLIRLPPVTLARLAATDGLGPLYLVDGFHRFAAHEAEGIETIGGQVVEVERLEEAKWLAAKGNLQNGLPLTRKEAREAFRRFIRARCHEKANPDAKPSVMRQRPKPNVMTLREIGLELGKPKSTIHKWMEKDFPRIHKHLYCRDFEEDTHGDATCSAPKPIQEVSRIDRMWLSLENVGRLLREPTCAAERELLLKQFASSLAEAALPPRPGGSREVVLNITLEDALYGSRNLEVKVSEGKCPPS